MQYFSLIFLRHLSLEECRLKGRNDIKKEWGGGGLGWGEMVGCQTLTTNWSDIITLLF